MRQLLRATSLGEAKSLVGLTFDDGYKDFLHNALPVLERFNFSATLFSLGSIPRENYWDYRYNPDLQLKLLEAEDLREIVARGIEVGSHGMDHVDLTCMAPEVLKKDLSDSRQVLSKLVGEEIEGFCYPYGSVDSMVVQAVRRAGYSYACSIEIQVKRNTFDLPRIPIGDRDGFLRFALKLKYYSQWRTATKILQRASAWRT